LLRRPIDVSENNEVNSTIYLHNKGGHIADAAHKGLDHYPPQLRAMELCGTVDDGTNTFCFDDGPYEKRDTGNRYHDGLGSEQVTTKLSTVCGQGSSEVER
jgi:hypothetical protein